MQRAGGMLRCLLLAAVALRTASAPTWTECPGISHVKNGDCNSPKHPCRRGCGATNVGKTATLAACEDKCTNAKPNCAGVTWHGAKAGQWASVCILLTADAWADGGSKEADHDSACNGLAPCSCAPPPPPGPPPPPAPPSPPPAPPPPPPAPPSPPPAPPSPSGQYGPAGQAGGRFKPGWNGKARTPPLGWRSWNAFGPGITHDIIRAQIDALTDRKWTVDGKLTSVQDLGYSSVGIDEGWELCHNRSGPIQRNGTSQPSGSGGSVSPWGAGIDHFPNGTPTVNDKFNGKLKALVRYAHSKHVEMGFYYNGCACANHGHGRPGTRAGSPAHDYAGDIALLHDAGFSGVKFDNCGGQRNLTLYAELMQATGANFTIENCHWGTCSTDDASSCPSRDWCPFNFFRSSGDINSDQMSWFNNLQSVVKTQSWENPLAGPHCWSNPDMLEVGRVGSTTGGGKTAVPGWSLNGPTRTWNWNRAHFGGWCIASAPLILGVNFAKDMTDDLLEIIGNQEAIAVNQAWAGHPGGLLRNISALTQAQIWVKPQPAGKVAVLIINAQNASMNASVTLAELNMSAPGVSVRDVWRKQELGQVSRVVEAEVGPTDSQFLLLTPLSSMHDGPSPAAASGHQNSTTGRGGPSAAQH